MRLKLSKHKYGAKQTTLDGITFDSKMEAEYYRQLKLLQQGKVITDLELQPTFELLESTTLPNGKKIRGIKYKADFQYRENGRPVVVDVKGARTAEFKIKEKLFYHRYPDLQLKLVTKKNGRWLEL
ncbi:DUF1064 domain-containing protein [Paenibacillus lautus]|uniref:DUF1064 domain-containing protein n=1 Tax=Paenibacillus lautus TaxID=1401 RepID=UPI003851437E